MTEDLRYPIGRFTHTVPVTGEMRISATRVIAELLRTLTPADGDRTFIHPEYPDGPRTIDWLLQQYAWHSRHHVAHITELRRREGWLR